MINYNTVPNPIFYFKKLNNWDVIAILLYVVITTIGYFFYIDSAAKGKQNILFLYSFSSQLGIYLFLYKSLRNLTSYLCWLTIAFFHLWLYFKLKDQIDIEDADWKCRKGAEKYDNFVGVISSLKIYECKNSTSGTGSTLKRFQI